MALRKSKSLTYTRTCLQLSRLLDAILYSFPIFSKVRHHASVVYEVVVCLCVFLDPHFLYTWGVQETEHCSFHYFNLWHAYALHAANGITKHWTAMADLGVMYVGGKPPSLPFLPLHPSPSNSPLSP